MNFPRNPTFLKPTRLGNVLAAAKEYSSQIYRLDAVIWWPRLAPLLPEEFRIQVDTALTPMIMMLNLSLIFILIALFGGGSLLFERYWWLFMATFIGGLLPARGCYLAAVNQALDLGGSSNKQGCDLEPPLYYDTHQQITPGPGQMER